MQIQEFCNLLSSKYGISYSSAQIRKLERKDLFTQARAENRYRQYEDNDTCVRPIILYFFDVPIEIIVRNNRDELKPYLARIRKAFKDIS
jgi:DNA-binding transcriptional MerR regulator